MTSAAFAMRVESTSALAALLSAGERIYLPGSTGEVPSLMQALCSEGAPPLNLTTSFVPGINTSPLGKLPEGTLYTSMFMIPGLRGGQASGRVRHLPLSYGGFAKNISRMTFDTCVVQVSPPDANGLCSMSTSVEFTKLVMARTKRIFGVVNHEMPRIRSSEFVRLDEFAAWTELEAPLSEYDVGEQTSEADAIAQTIAGFIGDGAAVEIGLGKVPDALLRKLADRRNLRLFSGMLSDGARVLVESGSLDPNFQHTCCVHVGTRGYYDWLQDTSQILVRGCDVTHSASTLAKLKGLVAVNSAVSVDLFGQANLEMIDGRQTSGVGGAPDFARGASIGEGSISIIALPSTSGKVALSRVVPMIDSVCSVSRSEIDVIVTEYGAADLRNCSAVERGERIIQIAAPEHRAALTDALRAMAARL